MLLVFLWHFAPRNPLGFLLSVLFKQRGHSECTLDNKIGSFEHFLGSIVILLKNDTEMLKNSGVLSQNIVWDIITTRSNDSKPSKMPAFMGSRWERFTGELDGVNLMTQMQNATEEIWIKFEFDQRTTSECDHTHAKWKRSCQTALPLWSIITITIIGNCSVPQADSIISTVHSVTGDTVCSGFGLSCCESGTDREQILIKAANMTGSTDGNFRSDVNN